MSKNILDIRICNISKQICELLNKYKLVEYMQNQLTVIKEDINFLKDQLRTIEGNTEVKYSVNNTSPIILRHSLNTSYPYVICYNDNKLEYYDITILDNNTLELSSPSGFVKGIIRIRK